MVSTLTAEKRFQAQDLERYRLAIEEIDTSVNLRFLIRSLLVTYGLDETPVASTPEETYRLAGRHQCAMELLRLLQTYKPDLYPKLLLEDYDENLSRRTAVDDYSAS